MALTDLIPFAEQVRDETQAGANTAIRVGQLFVDIITQAAQQDQTLAQALAALPALPFDSARFYTTDNQGQDQWTGDQAIVFLCNGVVVATLPIKVAAQAYSGLLSAADKTKIDAMPADPASEGDAIGSLIASATPTSTDITPYAVDGTIKTQISVPVVSKDILQGGAINAGVVTAALCNAADLYGQGLEVKVLSGQTLTLLLGGTRLYKGGVLQITELDGTDCQGFLSMSIDGLNVPIFNDASVEFFSGGTTFSLDLGNAMAGAGYVGEFGIVTAATLRAVAGRDFHVRLRVVDSGIMHNDIHDLEIVQSNNYVRLFGKNGGTIISQVDIPFASSTKAGIVSPADYYNWQEGYLSRLYNLDIYYENNRVIIEGQTLDGTTPTSYINAATATAAGVLTAALFTKLNALPDAASLSASLEDKADKSAAVGAIPNTTATASTMSMQYGNVDGSYMGTATIGTADASHAGVMTAAMFNKLDGIEAGAEKNVIKEVQVDGTPLSPDANGAVNVQVKSLLGGSFPNTTPPLDAQNLLLPADGTNYYLGNVSGLGLSWQTPAAKEGITMRFTASSTFTILVPFNNGDVPEVEHEIANETALVCSQGAKYLLVIVAACGSGGAPVNIVSLNELNTPS